MRILYHHRIASKDGQFVHVDAIISSLTKLGADVRVVAPKLSGESAFGGEISAVAKLRKALPKAVYELLELGYAFLDFMKMVAAIARFRPAVIYERYNLFFPSGLLASKLMRCPLILEVNAPLFDERSSYGGLGLPALARWTERFVWRNADLVLPVTQVLSSRIEQEGVPRERIKVLANGIDAEQFSHPIAPQQIPDLRAGQVVVGFVGFCREWHELDKLVALIAADDSKKLVLVIVGDGPVIPQLKRQVAELGCPDRVHFAGLVGRADMAAWLAAIDIAIQPAVVPYASPLKLIEYLATGKAIVAPAQANIRELLSHEHNALLFPQGDSHALMKAIRRLADDSVLRDRLAQAARSTITEKSLLWDENARKIVALGEGLRNASVATTPNAHT